MKYFSILILSFVLLSGACTSNGESIDDFSDVRTIECYDSLYSDKYDPLGSIREIAVADSVIVLQNSGFDYHFAFINAKTGSLITKWGKEGRGPGEYLRIGAGFSISASQLFFLDAMKKEINYLPLSNILNGTDLAVKSIPYPYTGDFRPKYIVPLNDKKIVVGGLKEGRFGILDAENDIEACLFDYPFDFPEIQGIFRGSVFQSKIKSNEKRNRFIIMTLVSDIFEIYENTDTGVRRVYISSFEDIPKIIEKPRPGVTHRIDYNNSRAGLMRLATSDDLICLTYSSESDIKASQNDKSSDEILCFDWDGKKIRKYILPFPINNFCIDRENIYGTRIIGEETVIYRFPMI